MSRLDRCMQRCGDGQLNSEQGVSAGQTLPSGPCTNLYPLPITPPCRQPSLHAVMTPRHGVIHSVCTAHSRLVGNVVNRVMSLVGDDDGPVLLDFARFASKSATMDNALSRT